MHVGRNCTKYFPEDVDPNRLPWWFAEYPVGKDQPPVMIDGVMTNECPVSLISSESLVVLSILNRSRHIKEATGSTGLGDISRLPAKFVDAIELVEIEKIRIENAKAEAQISGKAADMD